MRIPRGHCTVQDSLGGLKNETDLPECLSLELETVYSVTAFPETVYPVDRSSGDSFPVDSLSETFYPDTFYQRFFSARHVAWRHFILDSLSTIPATLTMWTRSRSF